MITPHPYYSLKNYNTFAVDVKAQTFIQFKQTEALQLWLKQSKPDPETILVLGGGSNILFTRDFPGTVIHNALSGMQIIKENTESVWIKAAAGMDWHQLVLYCVENHYYGCENLSLIPGTVGAAPIQNIGAYGAELKDIFDSLEALNIRTQKIETFSSEECEFAYRDSIFKRQLKGQYIILNVTLKLTKKPAFNLSYAALRESLNTLPPDKLSAKTISETVIKIRQSKLPEPSQFPNAGSFFKNPSISLALYQNLSKDYSALPAYATDSQTYKIPAAWLIEQCGWKGKRYKRAGIYPRQALVLVNYENACGGEILELANLILADVRARFSIQLEPEVTII